MFEDEPQKPKILLVDDKIRNLVLMKSMLEPLDVELYIAQNGKEALSRSEETDFDMILLDIVMPDIDGYEVCRRIKNSARKKDMSILFMSALRTREDKIKGFESGADDYLVKPLYEKELLARVQLHLKKQILIKQLKKLLKRSYHELYNPLSVIQTSAEMYGYYYPPNRYVDTMHAAAKSLHIIYEDLYYALSPKKGEYESAVIDMGPFLGERVRYFQLMAEIKNNRIELNAEPGCYVSILPADLQRIIDNTISNAIKYAFENSTVFVSLNRTDEVLFSVTNHGNNIQNPRHIFSEGYREAFEKIGMGIGLDIVASICQTHRIRTTVESADHTTRFCYAFKPAGVTDENHPL